MARHAGTAVGGGDRRPSEARGTRSRSRGRPTRASRSRARGSAGPRGPSRDRGRPGWCRARRRVRSVAPVSDRTPSTTASPSRTTATTGPDSTKSTQRRVERLALVLGVVLGQQLRRRPSRSSSRDERVALGLDAAQDLADEPAADAVGLEQDQGACHGATLATHDGGARAACRSAPDERDVVRHASPAAESASSATSCSARRRTSSRTGQRDPAPTGSAGPVRRPSSARRSTARRCGP